jgi:Tol biopolymer transport system component
VTHGKSAPVSPARWSPDGATIAFVGGDGDIRIVPADGRSPERRLTTGAAAGRVCWDHTTGALWANGTWGTDTLSFRIIDVNTGVVRAPAPPIAMTPSNPTFDVSRDGRRIVFARQELRGHLWVQQIRSGF